MEKIKTASGRDGARVLWTIDPENLHETIHGAKIRTPCALFSAAAPADVVAWLDAHPWARGVPLYLWHPDAQDANVAAFMRGQTETFQAPGDGFWSVTGPEYVDGVMMQVTRYRLAFAAREGRDANRIDCVIASAGAIAAKLPAGAPVWEICAEASGGGLLAIGAAAARRGPAVAVSTYDPGALGPMAATSWGVPLRIVLERAKQIGALDS
jgi:hypothetical protein